MNQSPVFPTVPMTDASEALRYLREGNDRYVAGTPCAHDVNELERQVLAEGQSPFAAVVCCADSRVVPEILFDQRLGNLFVIRNAGNVIDDTVLGSLEYAVEHLAIPLVVVMGHSSCGAVTAACGTEKLPGHIDGIAACIRSSRGKGASIDDTAAAHARFMTRLAQADPMLVNARILTAFYHIDSGQVEFWE